MTFDGRITWVTRSFLDYRVPVFKELDAACGQRLNVIFSAKRTPERVVKKMRDALGERAISLVGELSIGDDRPSEGMANQSYCIPYQPGILSAIRSTKPDVLVGDGFFRWTFPALLYRIQTKVPLVVCYERTHHTERHAQGARLAYRKFVMRWIDAMCVNGSLSHDYTEWLGYPPAHITVGHMVADVQGVHDTTASLGPEVRRAIRESWGVVGVAFLFVGQLIERKGVKQLLNAWGEFSKMNTGAATLVLVGDGPERTALAAIVAKSGLEDVRFVGSLPYDDVVKCYNAADVLVMPTLEDNWSLVVPEAMAAGLPIITSIYNGCWPELVPNQENGWVCDPCLQSDLVKCLKSCGDSASSLPAMGARSREIVFRNHTAKHAVMAILNACDIARTGLGTR